MIDVKGEPEFSRPVTVADLNEETELRIEADAAERQALAGRFDLTELGSLTAEIRVVRQMGAMVHVTGQVVADVTQSCVVTLAPVASHLEFSLDGRYAPAELVAEMEDDEEIAFEEEDPPEVIVDGRIDLGEAVAEQLALEINPFPPRRRCRVRRLR